MIDWFLGSKKKKVSRDPLMDLFKGKPQKKVSSKKKGSILDLFIGQGHPGLDTKTKQQKSFLHKTRFGSGKSHKRFIDHDGDGVISGLDCEWLNPKKHGIGSWNFKSRNFEEAKKERDEAIENHFREKGYYKYGGPDTVLEDDLQRGGGPVWFGKTNPIRNFVSLSMQKKQYLTPEEYEQIRNEKKDD
jgi:hypothetical protein